MGFIRAWLMGDAYVAVADEASTLFYNPAAIRGLPDTTATFLDPQLNVDEFVKNAILDPVSVSDVFDGKTAADLDELLGFTFFVNVNFNLPRIVHPEPGVAYGLGIETLTFIEFLQNPVLPALHFEFYADVITFYTQTHQLSENLRVGLTPKLIQRTGIDRVFSFGELFATGEALDLGENEAFQEAAEGLINLAAGLDIGFMYDFPFWPQWRPRMGLSLLNIGRVDPQGNLIGMEFGPRPTEDDLPLGGLLPQINTVGWAVSPTFTGIRYTMALDIVDFTRTALPGNDWLARTRLGFEMGLGIRDDGAALFSLLAGYNATHLSLGALARVWFFQVGFGAYVVELGEKAGDRPDSRFIFLFGMRI